MTCFVDYLVSKIGKTPIPNGTLLSTLNATILHQKISEINHNHHPISKSIFPTSIGHVTMECQKCQTENVKQPKCHFRTKLQFNRFKLEEDI